MTRLHDDTPLTDEELALAQRGTELLAAAMAHPEARAPRSLQASVAEAAARRRTPGAARGRARRWGPWLLAPGLATLVVAVAVLVGGREEVWGPPPTGVSLEQIAAVARRPADLPAPASSGGSPPLLAARVGRLSFPDWQARYAWQATGLRRDRVGGRAVTTVSYRYPGKATIAYAIVAGPPLGVGPGREVRLRGERYRVFQRAGRRTVTWTQAGHTCVIDAPSAVSATELVKLASWA